MIDVTGKKLGAALSLLKRKDKKTVFYLGSSSGYLCIGTAREIDKEIDAISAKWEEKYSADYFRIINVFLPSEEDHQQDIEKIKEIKTKTKVFMRIINLYEEFRPMRDRPITQCYELRDHGIALIIPGSEKGLYWTREEWEKREKHGNKKNNS